MRRFRASVVIAEEISDLDAYVIVLAERSNGTGMSLEIQHSLSFDARDRTRVASACLSTESGATHYGAATCWTLRDESLELHLDAAAARALEVEGGFWIDISPEQSSTLRAALRRVRGDETTLASQDLDRSHPQRAQAREQAGDRGEQAGREHCEQARHD
ncbi:MAG: Imm10 family immunity protein [Polyangiales bacterium]